MRVNILYVVSDVKPVHCGARMNVVYKIEQVACKTFHI